MAVDAESVVDVLTHPELHRRVRFELSEKEYLAAISLHPSIRKRMIFAKCYSVFVALAAIWIYSLGVTQMAIVLLILAVFFPLILKTILVQRFRRSYRSMSALLSAPIEIAFGQGFVAQETAGSFSYLNWLYDVHGDSKCRLLGTSSNVFVVVPVSAFENAMALAEFDSVVGELAHNRMRIVR